MYIKSPSYIRPEYLPNTLTTPASRPDVAISLIT